MAKAQKKAVEARLEDKLCDLLDIIIQTLITKIQNAEATAQDMKCAIELLKNNGITCDTQAARNPMAVLDDELKSLNLPFPN